MKKILFALALVAAAGSAAAQGCTYGFKAGANYANIWGRNAPASHHYTFGFAGGLALNYAFTEMASLQVEALYSQKGYQLTDYKYADAAGTVYKASGTQVLSYIDVPLLMNLRFGPVFVEAGPQIGYLLNSRLKSNYSVTDAEGNKVVDRTTSTDKDAIIGYRKIDSKTGGIPHLDIGLIVGAGYNVTPSMSLGLRYNAGIKTLVDTHHTPAGDEPRIFNNAFQAQVGYMFSCAK